MQWRGRAPQIILPFDGTGSERSRKQQKIHSLSNAERSGVAIVKGGVAGARDLGTLLVPARAPHGGSKCCLNPEESIISLKKSKPPGTK